MKAGADKLGSGTFPSVSLILSYITIFLFSSVRLDMDMVMIVYSFPASVVQDS